MRFEWYGRTGRWVPAVGLVTLLLRPLSYGTTSPIAASVVLAGCILAAVPHPEVVAHKVGKPFAMLTFAVAVTAIEGSFILSMMLTGIANPDYRVTPCSRRSCSF